MSFFSLMELQQGVFFTSLKNSSSLSLEIFTQKFPILKQSRPLSKRVFVRGHNLMDIIQSPYPSIALITITPTRLDLSYPITKISSCKQMQMRPLANRLPKSSSILDQDVEVHGLYSPIHTWTLIIFGMTFCPIAKAISTIPNFAKLGVVIKRAHDVSFAPTNFQDSSI